MDVAESLSDLAVADAHVAQGERHVVRQREIIDELKLGGHSTRLAESLLDSFEQTLASHVAHRDRILADLAAGRDC